MFYVIAGAILGSALAAIALALFDLPVWPVLISAPLYVLGVWFFMRPTN